MATDYGKWDKMNFDSDSDESLSPSPPRKRASSNSNIALEEKKIKNLLNDAPIELQGAVIFLHGSGDDGNNFQMWMEDLGVKKVLEQANVRLLCPTAKMRKYTLAGGDYSNVWFDRKELHPSAIEDAVGIEESYIQIRDIIYQLVSEGISPANIYVGGFSMGGCMALHFLAKFNKQLAGVFCFSSFLADSTNVYDKLAGMGKNLPPLYFGHGERDSLIPYEWGMDMFENFELKLGKHALLRFRPHNGDHEMTREALTPLLEWMAEIRARDMKIAAKDSIADFNVEYKFASVPGSEDTKVIFTIPPQTESAFVGKCILCRGGQFMMNKGETTGTIETTFYSPKPEVTANAIVEKIKIRLQDPSPPGMEACVLS